MKTILSLCLMLFVLPVFAANEITIHNMPYGSGTPGQDGTTIATEVSPGLYQAPQYMPGYPTSATLFPRVVNVPCTRAGNVISCEGYNWYPALGRGEYLLFHPVVKVDAPQPPVMIVKPRQAPKVSVYFDLNKAIVKPEFNERLQVDADYLKANPDVSAVITGNTDQRNNEVYNLALGQRRADAVKKVLVSMGVASDRISTISYGKKFLKLPCFFEKCFKENRRVDIIIK